jgi:hypothetical protein
MFYRSLMAVEFWDYILVRYAVFLMMTVISLTQHLYLSEDNVYSLNSSHTPTPPPSPSKRSPSTSSTVLATPHH